MKKNIFITIVLMTMSLLVIVFGRGYASDQEEKMLRESQNGNSRGDLASQKVIADKNVSSDTDTLSSEEQLEIYEEQIESLSAIERIDYQTLVHKPAVLTYYGDADSSSDWYAALNNYINENTGELTVENITYPEYDTYELYIEQTTSNVLAVKPDIILFRMPALADKARDIGLSETNDYLSNILTTLTDDLPDSEIILVEPEPEISEINNLNSRSLDYRDYMNEMEEVASELGIQVIAIHEQFITIAEEEGYELTALYTEDEFDLNEEGLNVLQQAIERGVTTKLEE
ncbi:hypothetical protein SAMN04488569_100185 [Marinilactibacillus piezotolerans]|uniref:SGNH/GDSL hydrolase family protein n=1 Tax=Marinilactibacillus piezotolerans TaxID=258723 RepID=A0A1I3UNK9_9LACT|nr:SGNH/GDSL hydrolase family protein [Marinilactibacillus piezotolerans]SFJ84984.1 hypothetical protein SAMN04488569_100185 [Marinilactibacillus piezotolerans]